MIVERTPHIEITNTEDLAKTVLMPGDPLRAKKLAYTFLEDVKQVNGIRGMLGYTGYYKGHKITVFASGMGQPSIGIYSFELFSVYGVEQIIRIGSAGSYNPDFKVYDTLLVNKAVSESTFAKVAFGYEGDTMEGSEELNNKLRACAKSLNIELKEGNTHSSDVFYHAPEAFDWQKFSKEKDVCCVEMESFALFANAKYFNKKAACVLTISDSFITHEATTSEERQNKFLNMAKVALEVSIYD